jgi:hypothetical protein
MLEGALVECIARAHSSRRALLAAILHRLNPNTIRAPRALEDNASPT